MTSSRDDWETPQSLFDKLDAIHCFTLDPCATEGNAKCQKFYTVEDDGLAKSWAGEVVFCNPPYGRNIGAWYRKCYDESERAKVVLLAPARTDTSYFHDYVYHKDGVVIEFLRGRLRFELGGVALNAAPFPSMIVTFDRGNA